MSVQELLENCFDENISVTRLLPTALDVAREYGLQEFEEWILLELNGYDENNLDDLPDYRKVLGEIVAFNPFRGIIPVEYETPEAEEELLPLRETPFT